MTADVGGSATDAEFAAGFQRDPELFTAVYDRYFRDVYRYVAGRLDTEAADDIAAETFLVAFGQRARYDSGRGGLRPWLFGIATNLVARHRRKEARHYAALAAQFEAAIGLPEERAWVLRAGRHHADLRAALDHCLGAGQDVWALSLAAIVEALCRA